MVETVVLVIALCIACLVSAALKGKAPPRYLVLALFALLFAGISAATTYESKIKGAFEGWDGDTIVELTNGQIWRQTEYYYEYHYAYMPDVFVFESGGKWKMQVEGMRELVVVEQLK